MNDSEPLKVATCNSNNSCEVRNLRQNEGERLRLRGGNHPLFGCHRHGHLALTHSPGGRQHDLHESHREGLFPPAEAAVDDRLPEQPRSENSGMQSGGGERGEQSTHTMTTSSASSAVSFSPSGGLRRSRPLPFPGMLGAARICGCFSGSVGDSDSDVEGDSLRVEERPTPATLPLLKVVEYAYELLPELDKISAAPFYWGRMDRFEAERLLADAPEGSFLLRDSAQPDFIFSVSFRRYSRTLHARIEQKNGQFGFDILDETVFSAPSIIRLIENYHDPARCLFFEPQLSLPLKRNFVFSLQHLCRAKISSLIRYADVDSLSLPSQLKSFVSAYHYSVPIRTTLK